MDDLLKDAIADAKAVRETALENAKIALEEAFTPRLQSMLSKKIQSEMEVEEGESKDLWPTILAGLAFTYLNPHVYVDTLLLIGGASSSYVGDEKLMFGVGAATASFVFFFSLGYGAKRLSPILNNPESWKIIDLFIAGIMFTVAGILLFPYLF